MNPETAVERYCKLNKEEFEIIKFEINHPDRYDHYRNIYILSHILFRHKGLLKYLRLKGDFGEYLKAIENKKDEIPLGSGTSLSG